MILPKTRNLRAYQEAAVSAAVTDIKNGDRRLVVMPTGSGKSIVIAEILSRLPGAQVLVITPRRNLLQQLRPLLDCHGVLSSGFGDDLGGEHFVVVGTYQTMTRRDGLVAPTVIIIDECHLLPPKGAYADLIEKFPDAALIGLTATPYRAQRSITLADIRWTVVYSVPMVHLIDEGWIVRPISMATTCDLNLIDHGDDSLEEVTEKIVLSLVDSVERKHRKRCLVFCRDIAHAQSTAQLLIDCGESAVHVVHSRMSQTAQREAIENFRSAVGRAWLVNVALVSIGVDIPCIDGIAILRNISSLALLIQIIGRGLRLSGAKKNCLIWDFGDGTRQFGFIDDPDLDASVGEGGRAPPPVKTCPDCGALIHASLITCPRCGCHFPRTCTLNDVASGARLLSKEYMPATYKGKTVSQDKSGTWRSEHRLLHDGVTLHAYLNFRSEHDAMNSGYQEGAKVFVRKLSQTMVTMIQTRR